MISEIGCMTELLPATETEQNDIGQASPLLLLFVLIPLIAILLVLLNVATELRNQSLVDVETIASPSSLLDFEAPYFELPNLDGDLVSLLDYRGKIVYLNFWQTTCPPCVRELPDFVNFIDEQDEDVAWLAINVAETPEMVRTFFAKHDFLGIPVLMDKDSTVRNQYGVIGFPVTYVLDTEGIVRHLSIGELSYAEMEAILEVMKA